MRSAPLGYIFDLGDYYHQVSSSSRPAGGEAGHRPIKLRSRIEQKVEGRRTVLMCQRGLMPICCRHGALIKCCSFKFIITC